MIGWFYLAATLLTVTAVAFTLPLTLTVIFGWPLDVPTELKIGLLTLLATTVLNVVGVRLLSLINNIGVIAEIIGMIVFAIVLLAIGHHQSLSVFFNTAGTEHTPGTGAGYLGVFLSAMFMALFVVFGFDTAGSLGEETVDPSREAPRGVLLSVALSFVAGVLFLGAAILAIHNIPAIMKSATPLQDIIEVSFGSGWGKMYLAMVSVAIFVCTLAIQAAAIRLMFSMGRDRRLPASRLWSAVHPRFGTPVWTGIATGVLAALPAAVVQQVSIIAIGATGLIYLAYFLTNLVILQARRHGWPQQPARFNLGRWAVPINILALVYGGTMLINFAWPRTSPPESNPAFYTVASWAAKWPVIGGTPLFELYVALLLIVGGAYWFLVQRHRVEAAGQQKVSVSETEPSMQALEDG
jgi:amino acid transporter